MEARRPGLDLVEVTQGHYRIGSRGDPFAYDNERPPQAVELSGFRIARRPVTNSGYLGFIESGGYQESGFWDEPGRRWLESMVPAPQAPLGWRRNASGHWYEINLNGPADLPPDQPVLGLNRHEAKACAAWVAGLGGPHTGAVLQHEYQWELAARSGLLDEIGHAWEWCANHFHPYPNFSPFPDQETPPRHSQTTRVSCEGPAYTRNAAFAGPAFGTTATPMTVTASLACAWSIRQARARETLIDCACRPLAGPWPAASGT